MSSPRQLRRTDRIVSVLMLAFSVAGSSGCTTLLRGRAAPEPPSQVAVECANALVVGLHWAAPDGRAIAGFQISRDGMTIGRTAELSFTDHSVSAQTHYSYSVAAVDRWGNEAAAMPVEVDTPAASARGGAPYCPSQMLPSVSFDWSRGYTEPNGSDLWPVTWGSDGQVYAFFGDGGGIGGDDHRGRASFGIASFSAPPPFTPATAKNVYGGYQASYPSHINGKASAIIAVGNDFYTVGGIYDDRDVDQHPHPVSGAPDRVQLGFSVGNAHSWQAVPWTFCRPHEREPDPSAGEFCPSRFVNFGPGNSGSRDRYVYLVGVRNEKSYWGDVPMGVPANTYLARVPRTQLLRQHAYRFYGGIDRHGKPSWVAHSAHMQPIFVDGNSNVPGCGSVCSMSSTLGEITHDFGLHRYLGIAQGACVGQTSLYEAPEPWGPWHVIQYNNIDPVDGGGGWGRLGTKSGGAMGVHIVNAWTSPDGSTIWLSYSSDGVAPEGAAFPPAGSSMDSLNLIPAHLTVSATEASLSHK
ncbi:MAG TPA: hypothetical protein VNO35_04475 [Steroidobacteraceae bacterium]|nr:hypothetical protein [Steroidobacteraceae bacterium]